MMPISNRARSVPEYSLTKIIFSFKTNLDVLKQIIYILEYVYITLEN
jgi:hypothetical protein